MKAVVMRAFEPLSSAAVETLALPSPATGQVRLRVEACGVSFLDALVAEGRYQVKPPLPFSPGSEFAGTIDALGAGVEHFQIGARVCGSAVFGGYAESVCIPAAAAHRIPAEMSFEDASVFLVPFATAYHALIQRAALQPGETLFVLGAGGAVGYAAVQLGRMLGARVIAGASTDEKRRMALEAGADCTIDTSLAHWRSGLKEAAGTDGVDVVCDPVGGPASELAFRCLNWKGRHLVVGFASGAIASLPLNLALVKGASAIGVDLRMFNERESNLAQQNFTRLADAYIDGALRPRVAKVISMESFADAMALALSGTLPGRVVMKV